MLYHVSTILSVSQELKEQFTAYRREKGESEAIIAEQMETLRQEASTLKMDNVKVTAKVRIYNMYIHVFKINIYTLVMCPLCIYMYIM